MVGHQGPSVYLGGNLFNGFLNAGQKIFPVFFIVKNGPPIKSPGNNVVKVSWNVQPCLPWHGKIVAQMGWLVNKYTPSPLGG